MNEPAEKPELTPLQKTASLHKIMEAAIVAQAWEDVEFRALLESDPKAALASVGMPVPEGTNVTIVTEQPNTLTIVLPPQPAPQSERMADDELEAVAGGNGEWGALFNKSRVCHAAKKAANSSSANEAFDRYVTVAICSVFGYSWAWQADAATTNK